jgi:hypothetical protein
MKNIYFLFLVIVVVGMCEKTSAQSQWIGIMPMEFNPSFAGNTGEHRIVALGGYERSIDGGDTPMNESIAGISYDNFISKIGSGVGFYLNSRKFTYGAKGDSTFNPYTGNYYSSSYNAWKAGLMISPKLSIRGKYTIAPSVGLNYKSLSFEDRQEGIPLNYDSLKYKSDIFYISSGLLFNTEKFYIGIAYYFRVLNNDRNARVNFSEEDYYPTIRQYGVIQAGYKFQKDKDSKTSYTLQKLIWLNTDLSNLSDRMYLIFGDITFLFKYKKLLLGTSHGSQSPFGIGYQSKNIRLFYSQNINVRYNNYIGELSCRVLIPNKKKTFYQF